MSNEHPTKTLLSVILTKIVSNYEDIVAMVSLTKMNSYILQKLFNGVMNEVTTIGYDAVVSLVDGHSLNVKFFKKELCSDNITSFIPNSVGQHRFLYLLHDTTHIFKCIYNNLFECKSAILKAHFV